MTTAAGGLPEKRLFDRVAIWCHHYDSWLWTAYVWTAILANLLIRPDPSGLAWWVRQVPLLLLALVMLAMVGRRKHEIFWDCDQCNSVEVDAPAQAQRRRKTLLAFHDKWQLITLGVIVFVAQVGIPFLLNPLLGTQFGSLALIPMWLFVLYINWVGRTHGLLQPWCPICRRRDEDDDPIDVPVPTPPSAKVEA